MVLNKQLNALSIFLVFCLLFISSGIWCQQNTIFNQYVYNNYLINPAKVGGVNLDEHRVALGYRTQWIGFGEDRPTTILANYDGTILGFGENNGTQLGIGVNVVNDQAHVISRTGANLSVAGHIFLVQNLKLSAGLRIGGINNSVNLRNIEVQSEQDPIYQQGNFSNFLFDAGGGLNLHYKTPTFEANIGASSHQLPSTIAYTDSTSFFLNTHLIPTATVRFNFSPSDINGQTFYKLGFEPAIAYRGVLNRKLGGGGLDAGLRVHLMEAVWFGGGFRSNGAGYYGSVGVKPMHNFEILGSYEFHPQLGTSFEVGLSYAFGRTKPPVLEARKEQKEIEKAKAEIAKQEAEEAKALAKKEEEQRKIEAEEREIAFKKAKEEAERKKKEEEAAKKEAARLAEIEAKKKEEDAKIAAKKAEEDAKIAAKKAEEDAKLAQKKAEEDAKIAAKEAEEIAKLRDAKEKEEAKLAEAKAKEEARLAEEQRKEEEKALAKAAREKELAEKEADRLAQIEKKKQEEDAAKAAKEAEAAAKEKERLAQLEREQKAKEEAEAAKAKEEEAKKDPCSAISNRNGIWFRTNRMQERVNVLELDFDFVKAGNAKRGSYQALNYEYSVYQEEYLTTDEVKRLVNEIVDISHDALNPCRLPKMEPEIEEISLYLKLAETKEELDFDSGYSYESEFGSQVTSNFSMDDNFKTITIDKGALSFEKIYILKLIGLRNAITDGFKQKGIEIPNSSIRLILLTEQNVDQEENKIEIILKPEE